MAKRKLVRKPDETTKNEEVKVPAPKKVVTSNSGKTGAKNTAPKKAIPDEMVVKTKRTPEKEVSKVEEIDSKIPISERVGPAKTKRLSEDKYERVSDNADIEKFKEMSQRIQNGSIQWAFYAVDGDKGYHYYLVLK